MKVSIKINGKQYDADVEPRLLLVHFIRDVAGLKGTHIGCDTGHCGACTVLLNGKPVKSCQIFAVQADGAEITTVEGLSQDDRLSIEQEAFVKHAAAECGYCTPGMLIMTRYIIKKYKDITRDEIKDKIRGNYCMCMQYQKIVDAIEDAHRVYWQKGYKQNA